MKKLPEKWFINPTNENESMAVSNWFAQYRKYSKGCEESYNWYFPAYEIDGELQFCYTYGKVKGNLMDGYEQITFSQFKQYVLEENDIFTPLIFN